MPSGSSSPTAPWSASIKFPEQPANLAWGGPTWSTLFATARGSVYRLETNVTGVRVPS